MTVHKREISVSRNWKLEVLIPNSNLAWDDLLPNYNDSIPTLTSPLYWTLPVFSVCCYCLCDLIVASPHLFRIQPCDLHDLIKVRRSLRGVSAVLSHLQPLISDCDWASGLARFWPVSRFRDSILCSGVMLILVILTVNASHITSWLVERPWESRTHSLNLTNSNKHHYER